MSNTVAILVSIPAENAEAALQALEAWRPAVAVVKVGNDGTRVGYAVKTLASPVSLGMGLVAGQIDDILRPFGGVRGGSEDWLLAAQKA